MTAQSRRISPILAPRAALLALMALLAVQAALAEKDYSREHAVVASFSTAGGAPEPLAAPKAKGGSLAAAYVWAVVPESLRPRIVTLGFFKIYSFARSAADGIADCDDDGNWTLDFDYDAAAGAAVAGDVQKAAYFD
jgi:hypothetical protein